MQDGKRVYSKDARAEPIQERFEENDVGEDDVELPCPLSGSAFHRVALDKAVICYGTIRRY